MDMDLLVHLINSCKKEIDNCNFSEMENIFFVMNYLYGDLNSDAYYSVYSLLRIYEQYRKDILYMENGSNCVYFLKDKNRNLIKVGCTKNIENRIKQLNTRYETIFELICLFNCTSDMYKTEHLFHKSLEKYRIKNEFFDIPDEMILGMKKIIEEGKTFQEIKNFINSFNKNEEVSTPTTVHTSSNS